MPIMHISPYSHNAINCRYSAALRPELFDFLRSQGSRALQAEVLMFPCIHQDIKIKDPTETKHLSMRTRYKQHLQYNAAPSRLHAESID